MALWADVRRQVGLVAAGLFDSIDDAVAIRGARARHLLQPAAHMTPTTINVGIERGLDFLRESQQRDGSFRDFLLPVGASDTWITAHVLFVLENVPHLDDVRRRGVDYLEGVGRRNGLWGYNRHVAPDVDSTAQALLALHGDGRKLGPNWLAFVLAQQRPSGGFATYGATGHDGKPTSGWQCEHPDVTLIVLELLQRLGLDMARTVSYLETCSGSDLLPPYWWNTTAYSAWAATRANFHARDTNRAARIALGNTDEVPALAMLLSAATASDDDGAFRAALRRLICAQLDDGSWPCAPCLRVTSPDVRLPHENAAGLVLAGNRRVLSTAHAVAALVASTRGV